ncbi:hypothetical protein HBI37_241150 [Parastagonospora nodorum]|nr:hypothetical protein HBI37_241150 [Parastagonospora nodorum]
MICGFQPKTYAELAKYTARYRKVHVCAADSLSSTIIVYNHIKKDKNADLVIADSISDVLDMCAKDDLEVLFQIYDRQLAEELATAESITAKDSNYVDTFSLDFAFSFANILSLITFIISYRLFADKLNIQQSLLDRATVVLIIILVNKTQLLLILGDRSTPSTLLAKFIPITKIRNPLLKKQKVIIQQLIAVVSLLFVLKAPFALHFIRAVCDLVTLAQYKRALERINVFKEEFRVYQRTLGEEKNFNYPKYICTRANSEAHYITIVKQFYSITNKKEYILQIYRKHIAYIGAFSKVLLFNNNRQIDNTTRILSMPFKFYDLSTIICLVHLVPRDLPNLITHTTISYYVNNYID